MNFQFFTDEFLSKWLSPENLKSYQSLNDRKIQAGVNWITQIQKSSFVRYDKMWDELKEKCLDCMKINCIEDYDWIKNNATFTETEKGFSKIKFSNKEIGKIGYEKVKSYHSCKHKCYEKLNIMNATLSRKLKTFTYDFSVCFVMCRGKPIERDTALSDCYSDCMIKHSYELPKIEYYIKMMQEKMIKEYNENKLDLPKTELIHNERFKEREFTNDITRKYL